MRFPIALLIGIASYIVSLIVMNLFPQTTPIFLVILVVLIILAFRGGV